MKKPKIVVAYSGGLDTSVMIKWLMETYNADVVTATGDLGQSRELEGLREKALATGASNAYVEDLKNEFVDGYIYPALKAGALYEKAYPLATALGRPLLARLLVNVARQEEATIIAHGCTGKGNDQVRFEVSLAALAPDLKVIAPLRVWDLASREDEIAYARKHGVPVAATVAQPYSIDENLWGTSIECGALEDPAAEPPEDAFRRTVAPEQAPDTPEHIVIRFEKGLPVSVNGEELDGVSLIEALNDIGGIHGVGRIDLVENRLVGIKSREVYETPGATILHFAHTELERLTLDKAVFHFKPFLAQEYANLVYNGLWYSPLKRALDAFVDTTQENVSGTVRLKLFKGSVTIAGMESRYSLYNAHLATYSSDDQFDHKASEGFIKIFGLPVRTFHQVQRNGDAMAKPSDARILAASSQATS